MRKKAQLTETEMRYRYRQSKAGYELQRLARPLVQNLLKTYYKNNNSAKL